MQLSANRETKAALVESKVTRPLRIVIDMQGAQTESRFRGIGRYTMAFAQAIVRNCGDHEGILALSGLFPDTIEPIRAAFDGLLPQENIRVWHAPGPVKEEQPGNEARRQVAELIREAFLASLQPDVIHVTSLFEGYVDDAVTSIGRFDTRTQVSVSLYDLIPLINHEHYLTPNPRYADFYLRKIDWLRQAACYLAISDFTKQEGEQHLPAQGKHFVNVSTAIDPQFEPQQIDAATQNALLRKFNLARPFILYTGGADERKNLRRLINAYAALPRSIRGTHQLLFAGRMPEGNVEQFKQIAREAGLCKEELLFTGYVSDEELVQLYNLCKLYVFPSWHEGFGLPALEAMACGAAVIGANTSSLPEVIGLDEALFDPLELPSIRAKLHQALTDEAFRSRLRNHGLQRSKNFSWDETAKRAIAAWKHLTIQQVQANATEINLGGKPRLAFVSPLPPERTGIADYSAELLPALAKYYEIDVVVAQEDVDDPWINSHCNIRDVAWLRQHAKAVDRILYHVGNSPFHQHMLSLIEEIPGTVVLHDFYMSGLMAWLELHDGVETVWTKALYEAHGYGAVSSRYRDAERAKREYPCNFGVMQKAQGIIVHSNYSRQLRRQWYGNELPGDWAVIPLLRTVAPAFDKLQTKRRLGFAADEFIICSFGFLDSTKLNHRLLKAWLQSDLASDKRCCLIFVGENHGGDYGAQLLQTMRESGLGKRIQITGFASPELFRKYLKAADIAVQLRTDSRGETSAAVLDCMNYGLPLIVNANGSMAELDREAVCMLPDDFDDAELLNALETLWREPKCRELLSKRAREIILERHAPDQCAKLYRNAIECFHERTTTSLSGLVDAITSQEGIRPDNAELQSLAQAIANNIPQTRPARRLFLDVTATCSNDLKTGIERVARSIIMALLDSPPPGYRIELVYLVEQNGVWHQRNARGYTLDLLGYPGQTLHDELIDVENGDILLILDISGDALVQAERNGLFQRYRDLGVVVYSIVYDLLPIRMPEVFPPGTKENHANWLRAVSKFDGAICISKSVADDHASWIEETGIEWRDRRPYHIGWWHLGADIANSAPSTGLPDSAEKVLGQLARRPSFMMVGTIEPRKAYLQVLEAFTQLWNENVDINLVIVGKEGWQGLPDEMRRDIPETVHCLRGHPQVDKRMFWLEGISDEYLEKVYVASTCLIAASYGEGFGLPLIEAAQHKLPIIARDIPVFREVAGEYAFYFTAETAKDVALAIQYWLSIYSEGRHPRSDAMPWLSWKESVRSLTQFILSYGASKQG